MKGSPIFRNQAFMQRTSPGVPPLSFERVGISWYLQFWHVVSFRYVSTSHMLHVWYFYLRLGDF